MKRSLTDAQLVRKAKKRYQAKWGDIKICDDPQFPANVTRTNDGTGAWVEAVVWVSLETPPKNRDGTLQEE